MARVMSCSGCSADAVSVGAADERREHDRDEQDRGRVAETLEQLVARARALANLEEACRRGSRADGDFEALVTAAAVDLGPCLLPEERRRREPPDDRTRSTRPAC